MKTKTVAAIAVASLTSFHAFLPAASAEEISCPPNILRKTVDNVLVTGTCVIRLSTVQGNIVVKDNGRLLVKGSTIRGSVQAEGAGQVRLLPDAITGRETRVIGDVQLFNMRRSTLVSTITANVGGTIIADSNQARINLFGNDVGGNIQVFQNRAAVRIRDNTIDGNLQCKSNLPKPINGGGNVVGGVAEDECLGYAQ